MTARRIQVVGASGSGKTTVAAELARRTGARHVELDALHWGAGWRPATAEELRAAVEPLLAEERWVVDGSYSGKLGTLVTDRAELVVWLDPPLRVVLRRLWRRTVRRVGEREVLFGGCRESWRTAFWGRDALFLWALRSHRRLRRRLPRSVPPARLLRLRSAGDVEEFLGSV